MKKQFIFAAAIGAFAISTPSDAQTAYRCDVNGAAVYSDKPCLDGKAVAPTQDSDAQQKRAKEASAQLKADSTATDRRIDERVSREARERAEQRKAQERERRAAEKQARADKAAEAAKARKAARAKLKAAKPKPVKPATPTSGASPT